MEEIYNINVLRETLERFRCNSRTIGFVPTLGSLHEGHASLIKTSVQENDITVCSIFVNPTQFDDPDDLARYPKDLGKDRAFLEHYNCDVLFAPSTDEMYPERPLISLNFNPLDEVMEGRYRKGHFNGVAMVVAKFFNIVRPDNAYFGQKDYQQFLIIKQLITDLSFGINLVCCPVVREEDGLALSSRNKRLQQDERQEAALLYKVLQEAKAELLNDKPVFEVKKWVNNVFEESKVQLQYFEIAEASMLQPLKEEDDPKACEQVVLCIAAFAGNVRLIDNVLLFNAS